MSRWKAAGIHLSINAVIALLAAGLIYGIWYPHPYSQAAGAGTLVLLLLGVDLVLGPLLTLVVFKVGKKGLKFDLAAIAILQVCAFVYGLHVVAAARPAFIVGVIDRFVLVSANELDQADLDKATNPEFRSAPWTGPKLVGAQLPTDSKLRNDIVFSGAAGKTWRNFRSTTCRMRPSRQRYRTPSRCRLSRKNIPMPQPSSTTGCRRIPHSPQKTCWFFHCAHANSR
jgi:hypothetical protein